MTQEGGPMFLLATKVPFLSAFAYRKTSKKLRA